MEIFTVTKVNTDHYDESPRIRTIFKNRESAVNYVLNELEKIRDEIQCDGCGEYQNKYFHCSQDCDYDLCYACFTIEEMRHHDHVPVTSKYPPPLSYYKERLLNNGKCWKEGVEFKIVKEVLHDDVKQSTGNWFKVKVDN